MKQDLIVILDLGSTQNTVLARDIRALGVYSEIHPHDITVEELQALPNVKGILSGMSTMEQVEDNLRTFAEFRPLSEKEEKTIEDIVALIKGRVQNGCTGCRYCMPCPAGVDIPGNFRAWNTYHMYQNYNMVKGSWERNLGDEKQAKNCVKCGKCEKACPQKLHIRQDLEKVQADLDRKEFAF